MGISITRIILFIVHLKLASKIIYTAVNSNWNN